MNVLYEFARICMNLYEFVWNLYEFCTWPRFETGRWNRLSEGYKNALAEFVDFIFLVTVIYI